MPHRMEGPAGDGPTFRSLLALGEAAGGVAHDFNNALTAIVTRATVIRAMAADPAIAEHAEAILRAARAAADVTSRVRTILKAGDPGAARVRVDLAQVIRHALELVQARAAAAGVTCLAQLTPAPPAAGLPGELAQLLTNLLTNAIDASAPGHRVRARLWGDRERLTVEILDRGAGIAPEVVKRVFDPFFSTKGTLGTGLGLTLCRRVVEGHGGTLELAPREGGGTVARVVLPAAAAAIPEAPQETELELRSLAGASRVLVVDDDAHAREALAALLLACGFEASGAGSVGSALALYRAEPRAIVVTDLGLPDGTGWELARALRALDPSVRVVVLSGSPEAADHPLMPPIPVDGLFLKPVAPALLVDKLRQLTDERVAPRGTK